MSNFTTKDAPHIGDKTEEVTIYAGISPDTGRTMYAAPADAHKEMQQW